jgi:hypothetical protein
MTLCVIFGWRPCKNLSDSLTEDRRRLGSFEVCDSGSFADVDMAACLDRNTMGDGTMKYHMAPIAL